MRCLALAQAWQDAGGRAQFAVAQSTPAIQARLASEDCEVFSVTAEPGSTADANQTIALAGEHQANWIVVDGYQFDADYQRALKAAGCKILFVDDYGHATHYSADIVLNQNISAGAEMYASREAQTRLLLGPHYCLLRREFSGWREREREIPSRCRRVLVMMGGSDPENLTARAIEALTLAGVESLAVTVVIGGSNPHAEILQTRVAESGLKMTVLQDVSNPAELMAAADVAISAAGSTCWELCLLGLPALLIDVADNQTGVAAELERKGCAIHVGNKTVPARKIADELRRLLDSRELRQALALCSRELVDGNGAKRVVSVLRGVPGLRLRPARAEDSRLLWEWANDAEVRAASFSPAAIPWEAHVAWFAEKLRTSETPGEKGSLILIAEDELATPVGQIRFDATTDGGWEVDVSVAAAARGRGLGSALIERGMHELFRSHQGARVHAFVKPQNTASVKAFEDAGFRRAGTVQTRGHIALHLIDEDVPTF